MNSLLGIAVILLVAYLLSTNRKNIRWRTVIGAFAIQMSLAGFVLYVPIGREMLFSFAQGVSAVIGYTSAGINFLFGGLASEEFGFVFAIQVLSVIVFFSSLISVLYYLGIMKWIIRILGGGLQKLLNTSRPESMSAAANIFVGQTEAPMMVRPFIGTMTRSELFAVMVGGMSSKMMIPECETPRNDLEEVEVEDNSANVIDAAASGASSGLQLAMNVGAMLLAFVALIALVNGIFGWVGGWFGYPGLTMQEVFGYVFQPVAYVLGISWDEAQIAGSFIGQKLVINEFVAYLDFVNYKDQLSEHSQVIITFVLCGFANFSSIAILLGGLGGMAPSRRHDIARLGMRALLAATMANMMSAAIAGFFVSLT